VGYKGHQKKEDGYITSSYENHYNKKMNKCFILQSTTSFSTNNKDNPKVFESKEVWDIQSQKGYGELTMIDSIIFSCSVKGVKCKSENEWE